MVAYVSDTQLIRRLKAERERAGADRWDEVWNGVYVIPPLPNVEHQLLATGLGSVIHFVISVPGFGEVLISVNVSDREKSWSHNYRCPDVAVFLKGTTAKNCGTHWWGGPDFAIEIISPGDRSRKKFAFYAAIGVRELLLIDRKPWSLELYRLQDGELVRVGKVTERRPAILTSDVLPLTFTLHHGKGRPAIVVAHKDGVQRWSI